MATLHRSLVGVFPTAQSAELAINELKASGFPMNQISVIARDSNPAAQIEPTPGNKAQEGTTVGAIAGGTVGGAIGLIVGLGAIAAVPGMGPIMLLGAAATALATTLGSSVLGATAGGLLGALVGYGIPEDQATIYHDRVREGSYVVIAEGTDAEVRRAEGILQRWHAQDLKTYNALNQVSGSNR